MLIVHPVHSGAHRYYLCAVGPAEAGPEPAMGECPGQWLGTGAAQRGLAGVVTVDALEHVLPRGTRRLPALDLTFAAPKTVSVLHGLGPPTVVETIRRAHDAAVVAGLEHLERHACAVRAGGRLVEASGLVVAAFRHRTSRADDPHLHTHALVVNAAVVDPAVTAAHVDGRPRALHTPLLYGERRGAAAVYHAVLRHRLSTDLGVTWTCPTSGRADVEQVPPRIAAAFSLRRREILASPRGEVPGRRWAERVTRPERRALVDAQALRSAWRARAEDLGWAVPNLGPGHAADLRPFDACTVIPEEDRWTRADLVVAIVNHWPNGAPGAVVEAETERLLAGDEVVTLGRRGERQACERFTTRAARDRQARVAHALGSGTVQDHVLALDGLRRELAGAGHQLLVAEVDEVAATAVADRTGAIGAPVQAMPAVMEALAAGPGDIVAIRRPHRLPSDAVAAVLEAAARRRVEVVATATVRAAGIDLRWPTEIGGAARQPAPQGHDASASAGHGMVATVPTGDGELSAGSSAALMTHTALSDWAAALDQGRPAVLVAAAGEVHELNDRARAALRAMGRLGATEINGFAAGDAVRFTAERPSVGIHRHQTGHVLAVDAHLNRLTVDVGNGRTIELTAASLTGVRYAHVVPPLAALTAGRGDVFALGTRDGGDRSSPERRVHAYVTVGVPGTDTPAVMDRRASLSAIADVTEPCRTALPPEPSGERSHLEDRARAAGEWLSVADRHLGAAVARRDGPARLAWGAQRAGALREVADVAGASTELARREHARHELVETHAAARSKADQLAAQARLREQALVRAAERGGSPSLDRALGATPADALGRMRWRQAALPVLAAAEQPLRAEPARDRVVGRHRTPPSRELGRDL